MHPDITAAISKIKVDSDKHIQDVVKTCYEAVVEYSPRPGHSKRNRSKGSFVQSHRIGVNLGFIDTTRVRTRQDDSAAKAMGQLNQTRNIKFGDTVTISNSLPYAEKVEYKGWGGVKSSTPAYHTYKKAESKTRARFNL